MCNSIPSKQSHEGGTNNEMFGGKYKRSKGHKSLSGNTISLIHKFSRIGLRNTAKVTKIKTSYELFRLNTTVRVYAVYNLSAHLKTLRHV